MSVWVLLVALTVDFSILELTDYEVIGFYVLKFAGAVIFAVFPLTMVVDKFILLFVLLLAVELILHLFLAPPQAIRFEINGFTLVDKIFFVNVSMPSFIFFVPRADLSQLAAELVINLTDLASARLFLSYLILHALVLHARKKGPKFFHCL